ncbi:helix-turn-helix domain-containing protein [Flavobacterium sp. NRK F7]|uniref:helix-turn-helix domain-containing protein n=1 Tax=Flavobacterium sp. NRK F7 TaxID=2954930 RepID=UPI0020902E10|nr:helix-turn-helix domain-containing protein [Flavobacterium sp. NRK F7]MCO6163353.1 helix-turn-helix domain-containing protein [Flavobacterium sp. NRK F7]
MKKQIDHLKKEVSYLKTLILELLPTKEEEWLDSADIKQRFNFSESKLYRLRKNNAIPHTKIGGRYHYPKSFFNQYLMKKIEA